MALIIKKHIFDALIIEFSVFGIFVMVINPIAKPIQITQIGFTAGIGLIEGYPF